MSGSSKRSAREVGSACSPRRSPVPLPGKNPEKEYEERVNQCRPAASAAQLHHRRQASMRVIVKAPAYRGDQWHVLHNADITVISCEASVPVRPTGPVWIKPVTPRAMIVDSRSSWSSLAVVRSEIETSSAQDGPATASSTLLCVGKHPPVRLLHPLVLAHRRAQP
eukprot:CAMPEP_0170151926 /NCGR_PEP_ID=MMETSP0033_2-20121228/51017_1 /TAXON_ID=195969 /ORGANISM="Dolichomastix tenuilepis, Strain CCMP3274" /LENGTH=165 /DNA_ID=CAMNT_0010389045 /DNA_START=21 /DNA_END=514 /DNA_ORIENTATION=+